MSNGFSNRGAGEIISLPEKVLDGLTGLSLFGYVASDVTYNNTAALAAVAGMSVTVATGGIYAVNLVVQSTSAVKSLLMDFGGTVTPANFVGVWETFAIPIEISAPTEGNGDRVTEIGAVFDTNWNGNPLVATFTGTLEVTTGGTFLLRGAQNAADASDTKILRGSYMEVKRIS